MTMSYDESQLNSLDHGSLNAMSATDVATAVAAMKKSQDLVNSRKNAMEQFSGSELTRLSGEVLFAGAGEGRADVVFPSMFVEKPMFSFGGELPLGQPIIDRNWPTVSVIVTDWLTLTRPPFTRLYYGASLLIVCGGLDTQKLIVHWHMDGKTMSADPIDMAASFSATDASSGV